ncbi:MAG: hypothetical protein K2L14_10520 [Duncaniella sp.]|nr:hypothetical protein [Duncaniella sp.]
MMKNFLHAIFCLIALTVNSCADHDNPELAPIDTSKVKITADVEVTPSKAWLNPTEEITVKVSDVEMTAPKGVVLRNINLMVDGRTAIQKPYSGETLEFKVPLNYVQTGRINIALWGDLVQQNYRDAQIIIADNIQHVVFSETPEFKCDVIVDVTVRCKLSSGETIDRSFQVKSDGGEYIMIPASELYFAGDASATLEVTMAAIAEVYSTNSTLKADVARLYWSGGNGSGSTIRFTMPNTPGYLNTWDMGSRQIMLIVNAEMYGTWENVTVTPLHTMFVVVPKEY